jgi:DNA-binding MarR family transcriptional regulator
MAGNIEKYKVSGKLLYMLLSELADENGRVEISHRKLGRILGIHRSTVSKNLRKLEASGDIFIYSRYDEDGGRIANVYVVR